MWLATTTRWTLAPGLRIVLLREQGFGDQTVVVDIGAGTGQFTLVAAAAWARVVAVDVSPVMLERLGEKLALSKFTNVELVQAGFLSYQHRGGCADVVYSRLALHHLPDAWKAIGLARVRGMLREGGLLRLADVVYGFEPGEAPGSARTVLYGPRGLSQWQTSFVVGYGPQ